ncbi:hypothetical protein I5Q41_18590 [Pseudomonas monteilii]|uniref:hypothetical protein n=1 Tax=Pseudomonas monteilii TaxID=76759 RepID=UPI0018D7A25A|nr:hypothetical protein [Pseudomonas monteilii]MBH3456691.1 hypothetical protein [Pseudomonas monteilii]
MPTENRSNDADGWIACDDGLHLIQMDKNLSHYGWVFRKVDGSLPYSVREATSHEMAHAQARQHLRAGVAQIAGQAPAPQAHPEPAGYPPCDYCGTVPSYHPWHGSGMLNGVENRHIHACDGCRGQLPSHPGQTHPEPIAWMVGTAFWWTKEEAERDAAATGKTITPFGPMVDTGEVERLSAACAANIRARDDAIAEGRRYMGQAIALDAVLREARRCVAESADPETGGPTQREAQVILGKIDAALSASPAPRAPAPPYPNRLCHIDYTAHPHRCGCLKGDEEAQRRYDEHCRADLERQP